MRLPVSMFLAALALGGASPALAAAAGSAAAPASSAAAVDPARLAVAERLVGMLGMERTLDTMFGDLRDLFAENVIGQIERGDDGTAKALFAKLPGGREHFVDLLGSAFVREMQAQYPDFRKAIAAQYASRFSLEDLTAMTAFFESEAGRKWMAATPQLQAAMRDWGQVAGAKAGAQAFADTMKQIEAEAKTAGSGSGAR